MEIFPAIDLYGGQAVRLYRGDYARMTVYDPDPLAVAKGFAKEGARFLHVVDLEGARDGGTPHFDLVASLAAESGLQVEVGGGIRDAARVERYLEAGVFRVVLGTAALCDRAFLRDMLGRYGERIAVGADVRDGFIAVRGWRETSDVPLADFCGDLADMGVKTLICTDISKDGALQGTNRELYRALLQTTPMDVVASGGVTTLGDIAALREIGVSGAILGRALYTGDLLLRQAIEVAK